MWQNNQIEKLTHIFPHISIYGNRWEKIFSLSQENSQGTTSLNSWLFLTSHIRKILKSIFFSLWSKLELSNCKRKYIYICLYISSVQSPSVVLLFATPWTAVHQVSLSIMNSRSLLKLMSIESVMPSSHLMLCHPILLPPSIFPSIRIFSHESLLCIRWPKYWSISFSQSFQKIFRTDFL